jgi:hypothetical protein
MITDLPPECVRLVADKLVESDRCMLSSTCRQFRNALPDRRIDGRRYVDTMERYLGCLRMGCELTARLAWELLRARNDEGLLHARSMGCPLDHTLLVEAARAGRIDVLQWATRNGAGFHADVMDAAASGAFAHVVRWLHDNGCPMRARTCAEAAGTSGSIPVLKEIIKLRGRLEGATDACIAAKVGDHMNTAKWIIGNHDVDMAAIRLAGVFI